MGTKKVLVLCGSGAASSTVVAEKVKSECRKRGIPVEVETAGTVWGGMAPLTEKARRSDLVIIMGKAADYKFDTPKVSGMAFLTGIGLDKAMDEIEQILKS